MFNMTKGKMRAFTLTLSVIVIFGLLSALMVTAAPAPVPDGDDVDDSTSMQTFEFDKAAPNFISPVSPVVAVAVAGADAGNLPAPSSSPQVWKAQAMDHHHLQTSFPSPSYPVLAHPGPESTGHPHHYNTSHQFGRRHSWALNCEDDRTYTNACTRKGYSCDSTGKLIARGYDWWCSTRCRCTNLSPKSCRIKPAVYAQCYFKGENIMGADGTVIGNIYTAEDVGNDTLVLH
ncbi:hypothetical protein PV08_00640 [Exophiala spinifera]|uniref:Uncharacterized protein n=1 Tax=Exophiala spinifera TaxID=91928 RepID=A0A0D2BNG0_9EURO|nr:uncharacterized protein PV08_00640 [Exophiala spinifera]KIW20065.1 hypothetical protein PV08_00640 [Exophiala spinifera]